MHGDYQSNSYTHQLSLTQINDWSDLGNTYKEELASLFRIILLDLRRSKSHSKVILRATKKLEDLSLKYPTCRSVIEQSPRRLSVQIHYPLRCESGLVFRIFRADISARAGQVVIHEESPIQMTVHALQRLMERLNPHREDQILEEIYSCMWLCLKWNKTAQRTQAETWPLLSKNGFFVTTANQNEGPAILVTYILNNHLSTKWKSVLDALQAIEKISPKYLNDELYIEGFIRAFPWLEKEHAPDALNSNPDLKSSIGAIDATTYRSGGRSSLEIDLSNTHKLHSNESEINKPSRTYKSGLNYKKEAPPFKVQTKFEGLVIKKGNSADLIISLNNGWIGKLTNHSRNLEKTFGVFCELHPGDRVDITVSRLLHFDDESAWLIHLDRTDLVEARWQITKETYKLGLEYYGEMLDATNGKSIIAFEKHVVGRLPFLQMIWLRERLKKSTIGKENRHPSTFKIVGYTDSNKSLLVEIPDFHAIQADALQVQNRIGDVKLARFKSRHKGTIYLTLDTGVIALLSERNCWDRPPESNANDIQVVIIGVCPETNQLHVGLPPPTNVHKAYYSRPLSKEDWKKFGTENHVSDVITAQITSTVSDGYMCALENGIVGKIHFKNLDWYSDLQRNKASVNLGDLISARIVKFDHGKKVYLERKTLISNPLLDGRMHVAIGENLTGVIATVTDYGYFVDLSIGITALLHKSGLSYRTSLQKSDTVSVEVIEIDRSNGRILLKLLTNY
jgi:ribosomal protein S1